MSITIDVAKTKTICYTLGVILIVIGVACCLEVQKIPDFRLFGPTTYHYYWPHGNWILPLIGGGVALIVVGFIIKAET